VRASAKSAVIRECSVTETVPRPLPRGSRIRVHLIEARKRDRQGVRLARSGRADVGADGPRSANIAFGQRSCPYINRADEFAPGFHPKSRPTTRRVHIGGTFRERGGLAHCLLGPLREKSIPAPAFIPRATYDSVRSPHRRGPPEQSICGGLRVEPRIRQHDLAALPSSSALNQRRRFGESGLGPSGSCRTGEHAHCVAPFSRAFLSVRAFRAGTGRHMVQADMSRGQEPRIKCEGYRARSVLHRVQVRSRSRACANVTSRATTSRPLRNRDSTRRSRPSRGEPTGREWPDGEDQGEQACGPLLRAKPTTTAAGKAPAD